MPKELFRSAVPSSLLHRVAVAAVLSMTLLAASCSSGTAASTAAASTTGNTAYAAVYKTLTWGSGTTVTFPTSCTMTITSNGVPSYHDPYYLAPASSASLTGVVKTTPSGLQLTVTAYAPSSIASDSNTLNICPSNGSTVTATNKGPIGYITNGEFLYNAFEATNTAAFGDNVSYSYTTGGTTYTAYFIDTCNSHATPVTVGYTWHFHGVPLCVTAAVDGTGPSHIIGIAMDGYPVYGGRDVNGNVISVSQLDACNGITSATPEFPNGAYHYVLPLNTTSQYSSMNCFTGTVSGSLMAKMEKLKCRMKNGAMPAMKMKKEDAPRMAM